MTGSSIPQRACLYKNIFSPQTGHFRLGNSRAMLIHFPKTLLSANGSLFPSLKLIVWFYTFSSGTVHLVTLVSDRAEVANLYRITPATLLLLRLHFALLFWTKICASAAPDSPWFRGCAMERASSFKRTGKMRGGDNSSIHPTLISCCKSVTALP